MKNKALLLFIFLIVSMSVPLSANGFSETYKMVTGVDSLDIGDVLASIHFLDKRIHEIKQNYEQQNAAKLSHLLSVYEPLFQEIITQEPALWETDDEFSQRLGDEVNVISLKYEAEKEEIEGRLQLEFNESVKVFQELLDIGIANVSVSQTIESQQLTVIPLEYDRNLRQWALRLESLHPVFHFNNFYGFIDFQKELIWSEERDFKQELLDFDKAVKEGGVTAEVSCKLSNHLKDNTFIYVISQIQIINPINNIRYELSFPESYLMVRVSGDTILQTEFLTELFPFYLHEEPNLEPDEYEVTVPIPVVPLPMVEPSSKTNGFSLSEIASESSGEIASEIIVSQVEQDAYEEKVFPSYVKKAVVEIGEPVGLRDSNTVRVSKSNITLPQVPSLESDTTSNTPNGFGVGWSIGVFSYTLDMYYSSQGIQLSISLGKAWNNYMNISGVMLCEFESFTGKNNPFHLYIGFGEIAIFEITPSSVVVSSIGLVMPIHLSYFTDSTKWEIFGRLSPGVVINFQSTATSEASFVFEAALGVTYYF